MTKRIVLTCWGSHGDLFPYIGLALALKARGHRPIVATLAIYKETVEREGLEFAAVGPLVDPHDTSLIARLMDPVRGSEVLVRELLMSQLERTYEELTAAVAGADSRAASSRNRSLQSRLRDSQRELEACGPF